MHKRNNRNRTIFNKCYAGQSYEIIIDKYYKNIVKNTITYNENLHLIKYN